MMDHYSQYAGPSRNGAVDLVKRKLVKLNKPDWLNSYATLYIDDEISKYGSLGSQTGWSISTEPHIWGLLMRRQQLRERSHQLLRKLFTYFRSLGVVLKLYKDIHYKPNGVYMQKVKHDYKQYFKL